MQINQVRIAQIVEATRAEGPGLRMAIWFQGCPLRCPGCCNPEMLKFEGGTMTDVDELCQQITNAKIKHQIEGITLLGGEPFSHADGADEISRHARAIGLTVMAFTGNLLEEIQASCDLHVLQLLQNIDLLIDGPYERESPDTTRRWIGSLNQRIHFLTDRYSADDHYWSETDTLEVRYTNGVLTVNGFPAKSATGLWKRPRNKKPSAR